MARQVPCARATRGLGKPSLDARSGGLIRVILGKRQGASLEELFLAARCGLARGTARLGSPGLSG
jgi:hypothetical protein